MLKQFKEYIANISSGKIQTRSETAFKGNTLRFYSNVVDLYEQYGKDIDLKSMDLSRAQHRVGLAEQFEDHFRDFASWLRDRGMKPNSVRSALTVIGVMVRHYADRNYLMLPRVPIPKGQENPIITLPVDFVREFLYWDYESLSPEHRFMWEVCATMLVTSLRISDAVAIKKTDLLIDGDVYLVKDNKKTGAKTTLPLPKVLYEKYLANLDKHDSVYTNVNREPVSFINHRIKDFFSLFPSMHEPVYGGKKYYELVHPHMLRKTAITTMLANGVSIEHVRFASGHKSDAINRYIGWVDKTHKSEIKNYYKQFLNL